MYSSRSKSRYCSRGRDSSCSPHLMLDIGHIPSRFYTPCCLLLAMSVHIFWFLHFWTFLFGVSDSQSVDYKINSRLLRRIEAVLANQTLCKDLLSTSSLVNSRLVSSAENIDDEILGIMRRKRRRSGGASGGSSNVPALPKDSEVPKPVSLLKTLPHSRTDVGGLSGTAAAKSRVFRSSGRVNKVTATWVSRPSCSQLQWLRHTDEEEGYWRCCSKIRLYPNQESPKSV